MAGTARDTKAKDSQKASKKTMGAPHCRYCSINESVASTILRFIDFLDRRPATLVADDSMQSCPSSL